MDLERSGSADRGLTADYNEQFNSIRPREYDGSHLHFYGMNPEITLRKHQKDGVARIIYGGNTLLAYVVGAGKTYTMVAAAMECKRLGLCINLWSWCQITSSSSSPLSGSSFIRQQIFSGNEKRF